MSKTTVGALVVTFHRGGTSTYRWIDQWAYKHIVVSGLENTKERAARAAELLPTIERDARELSGEKFLKQYKMSPTEAILMLRSSVDTLVVSLRTIEVEPIFKGEYLGYGGSLQINFADVKSVAFKEARAVDNFGP
jgi:hypothetical protein